MSNWSLYVLVVAGAATLLLASHALAAGPLAASQPGFTILDPLSASLLGLFLFGEHIQTGVLDLGVEALALALIVGGVSALSHSHLIEGEDELPAVRAADLATSRSPSQHPGVATSPSSFDDARCASGHSVCRRNRRPDGPAASA